MKKAVLSFVLVLALVAIGFVFLSDKEDFSENDQLVLQKTLDISKSYTVLRLKTDDILMNARNYSSHEEWQAEMNIILLEWSDMEKEALALENLAGDMFDENISFKIINSALAYDRQEISDIFDRAPAGKKIATLAKHLGVDAKRAFAILTQDQAQVQADAWNEAGDTFKKLETTAVAIKNTSKVVVFVGTIVVSGGTTAVAAGSTLSKAAVVVAGADLTLEVTDDAAKIALGDKNKISSVVGNARKITEPAAAILMISTLPKNITKAVDKLGVATFGSEQLNSSVQEGKVIGISLPTAVKSSPTKAQTMTVSVLENTELEEWLNDEEATETKETIEEIKTALEKELKNDEAKNNEANNEEESEPILEDLPSSIQKDLSITETELEAPSQIETTPISISETKTTLDIDTPSNTLVGGVCSVAGTWEGLMEWTESEDESESERLAVYTFGTDGAVVSNHDLMGTYKCIDSNTVHIYDPEVIDDDGYYEFSLSGDALTFIKIVGPDEEGRWREVYAADFFGGLTLALHRK